MMRTEPNIIQILKEPMRLEDRVSLVHMYEIYKSHPPSTDEWLEARNNLNKMQENFRVGYRQYQKYSCLEHEKMENEVKGFSGYDSQLALRYKILGLETSKDNKEIIFRKYQEFSEMKTNDDEYGKLKNWLNCATTIPHDKLKTFPYAQNQLTDFLRNVMVRLDNQLYGMKKVKEQILIFLNAKLLNPSMKKCSLGLIGPPGCGKTAISRLLASILDYPFEQISFGGVSNPEFLKGHEYTYVGAQPGEIVKCLKRMKYKNGILFLDEYEKISDNKDLCSALLHITDPTQNTEYRDHFLSELTIDLSHLWFIYSMNSPPEDSALRDRIFSIEIPGYSHLDKIKIVEDYLLPKALCNIGLEKGDIFLSEGSTGYLINRVCKTCDKGVRTIEKAITDLINKIHFLVHHQDEDGQLTGFNISFDVGQKLIYPLKLTSKLVDKFVDSKELDIASLSMMYI